MVASLFKNIFKAKPTRKSHFYNDFIHIEGRSERPTITVDSYRQNVIVYRCVNIIAQAASHVPWLIYKQTNDGPRPLINHPLGSILKRPNPEEAGADFFGKIIASKLLYGNAYILSTAGGAPEEIYVLNSSQTDIEFKNNQAVAYKYNAGAGTKLYHIDPMTRFSKVLHLKSYHPTNHHYGLSSLEAAALSIDLHDRATIWNNSLLKNGARPSGALVVGGDNSYLSDEQFQRLQEQLYDKYTGSYNSGKPLLLEGGLSWQEMSMNPKDMDFIESKNSAAREIALAFGVPPQILGIKGDNTYSNMQEARLALWEETLIPLLDKLCDAMSNWFSHLYQDHLIIDFDRDAISALTEKRENLWAKIASASFMTINEKRAFVGLCPIEDGDKLQSNIISQC